MSRALLACLICVLGLQACGSQRIGGQGADIEPLAALELYSAQVLVASPDGVLWIGDSTGHLYRNDDWNQLWKEVSLPDPEADSTDALQGLWFFDARHALLSGQFLEDGEVALVRTEDGGNSWIPCELPKPGRVHDAQLGGDGCGWLAVEGCLLRSTDFGRTWSEPGAPFPAAGISAIHFRSAAQGFAGSFENGLRVTSDGGRSWVDLATPADELCPPDPEQQEDSNSNWVTGADGKSRWRTFRSRSSRVQGLWSAGDLLLAAQEDQIFKRTLATEARWSLFEVDGQPVKRLTSDGSGFVFVTPDQRLVRLSPGLERIGAPSEPLSGMPFQIATCARGVAALTASPMRLCTWSQGPLEYSSLRTLGGASSWRFEDFDRGADGTLYAVSTGAMYESKDAGKSWRMLIDGCHFSTVRTRPDGETFLLQSDTLWCEWSRSTPEELPRPLSSGSPGSASLVAKHGKLWVAVGFDAADDEDTQHMLRSSDTVLRGDGFTACVYASPDEGRTWKRVNLHKGAIVHASWLGPDDTLSLCMSDHTLRQGRIDATTGVASGEGIRDISQTKERLGGQWASWLAFPEPEHGLAGGIDYFGPAVAHESRDGGRTWADIQAVGDDVIETYLLGGGACVRIVGFWDELSRVEIWRDGRFEVVGDLEEGAHDARIDSTGCLLIRLTNGDVWCLDAAGTSLRKIANVPLPPR